MVKPQYPNFRIITAIFGFPNFYGTIKFLNIRIPKKFAVVTLKFEQDGFTKE